MHLTLWDKQEITIRKKEESIRSNMYIHLNEF